MKTNLSLLLLLVLLFPNSIFGGCAPVRDSYLNTEESVSCSWNSGFGQITMNNFYAIRWSDNSETTSRRGDFLGLGECYSTFAEGIIRCDPAYTEKRYDDNGASGRFNVLIEHQKFQTGSNRICAENYRQWNGRNHWCTSGSGGEECNLERADSGGGKSLENESNPNPDLDCCSDFEATQCIINGGMWVNCTCVSPIVIDILGNGFNLTNAQNGVSFDILNTGEPLQIAWTSANSDDAWLALDRNGNGRIDKGRELFGSSTPQPQLGEGEIKNGFRALAVFDRTQRGGNADGQIDSRDDVFSELRLWQDVNHNGISEAGELHRMHDLGIRSIDLDYKQSRRQDEHGNWFGFRAKVKDMQGAQAGRWAWDVFLKVVQ